MANLQAIRPAKRTIDLGDGVEREVRVTLNAMAELEEKYGSIEKAFDKVKESSVSTIRFLLWCILVPEGDAELTEKQVGAMIDLEKLNEIMDTVMDVFNESLPENTSGDSPKANGPNRQTLASGTW